MKVIIEQCLVLLPALVILIGGVDTLAQAQSKESLTSGIVQYSDADIMGMIRKSGYVIEGIKSTEMNQKRSSIFVTPWGIGGLNSNVFVVSGDTVVQRDIPAGAMVFFGEGGSLAAWFRDLQCGVHLASGQYLHLDVSGVLKVSPDTNADYRVRKKGYVVNGFDVDPSGRYFVFQGTRAGTYLGEVRNPIDTRPVATNFNARRVFLESGAIYICGWLEEGRRGKGVSFLRVKRTVDNYQVDKVWEFSGMNSVLDLDQNGERVLLNEDVDLHPRLYVESLVTRKRVCLGRATKRVVFFSRDRGDP